jgi:hypothetical protein
MARTTPLGHELNGLGTGTAEPAEVVEGALGFLVRRVIMYLTLTGSGSRLGIRNIAHDIFRRCHPKELGTTHLDFPAATVAEC